MRYAFGSFELDETRLQLSANGQRIPIEPKALEVLLHLVRNSDRNISREELLAAHWDGAVSDTVLARAVSIARRALGDPARAPRLIRTLPRRGYRFVGPVRHDTEARAEGGTGFVGRAQALSRLAEIWSDALSGRGRVALIAGEAGIGKTRTAHEFARGAVGYARLCAASAWEGEEAPPLWPWAELLRRLTAQLGSGGSRSLDPVLARLVPELRPGAAPSVISGRTSASEQFALYEALARAFGDASRATPIMLLLDDLHAADSSTLRALTFLGAELRASRTLVLACYRDDELVADHPLRAALDALRRQGHGGPIRIGGLSQDEVEQLAAWRRGGPVSALFACALWERTGGNPLFIHELLELLGREDDLRAESVHQAPIPRGVEQVIARRLARLSASCREVLEAAAVAGPDWDPAMLRAVTRHSQRSVLAALDEALGARVVARASSEGKLRFVHALLREVLRAEIAPGRRAALHARVARALEAREERDLSAIAQIAAHYLAVAHAGGGSAKAVEYASRAAELASGQLAFDEAVIQRERALEALGLEPPVDNEQRCMLLVALGESRVRAGDIDGSRRALVEAAELARRIERPQLLARAAMGMVPDAHPFVSSLSENDRCRWLEIAHAALPQSEVKLRARLLSSLSAAQYYASAEECSRTAGEALRLARGAGPRELGLALGAHCLSLTRPATLREILAVAREASDVAASADPNEGVWLGCHLVIESLRHGRLEEARAQAARLEALATRAGQPLTQHFTFTWRQVVSLAAGELDEVGRAWEAIAERARRFADPDVLQTLTTHRFYLALERGGLAELEAEIRMCADRYRLVSWRWLRANTLCQLGREADARRELDAITGDRLQGLGDDFTWSGNAAFAAASYAQLGERARCEQLYAALAPHEGLHVLVANVLLYGPFARYLGLLAETLGDLDLAADKFEAAEDQARAMAARPFAARCAHDLARVWLQRGRAADRFRAEALLLDAARAAEQLGMSTLQAELRATAREAGLALGAP